LREKNKFDGEFNGRLHFEGLEREELQMLLLRTRGKKTENTRIVMSDHIDQSTASFYYCAWPPASTFKHAGNDCKKGSRRRNDLKRAFPERKKRDQLTVELTCRFEVWKPRD
jgi:hypothetical protein